MNRGASEHKKQRETQLQKICFMIVIGDCCRWNYKNNEFLKQIYILETKCDWDFQISDLVKNKIELILNPCGELQ